MTDQNYPRSKSFLLLLISILLIFLVFASAICIPLLHINTRMVAILPAMLLLTGPISIVGFIWGIVEKKANPVFRWIGLIGNGLIVFSVIILFVAALLINIADVLRAL